MCFEDTTSNERQLTKTQKKTTTDYNKTSIRTKIIVIAVIYYFTILILLCIIIPPFFPIHISKMSICRSRRRCCRCRYTSAQQLFCAMLYSSVVSCSLQHARNAAALEELKLKKGYLEISIIKYKNYVICVHLPIELKHFFSPSSSWFFLCMRLH